MAVDKKLEAFVRGWAAEIKSKSTERVLEFELVDSLENIDYIFRALAPPDRHLFVFYSKMIGDFDIIQSQSLLYILRRILRDQKMLSIVEPFDGSGLTLDVSDEGKRYLTMQIAGWGEYIKTISMIASAIPNSLLLK